MISLHPDSEEYILVVSYHFMYERGGITQSMKQQTTGWKIGVQYQARPKISLFHSAHPTSYAIDIRFSFSKGKGTGVPR
jgi:hypothetical protein